MAAYVAILCIGAASRPDGRQLLMIVITGLVASALILFRQLRKATNSLIASEARAHYAATHDQLTQLPNKSLLADRLRTVTRDVHSIEHRLPTCLFSIGLDRLADVNNGLGLGASDEVILETAARLSSLCRGQDIVARLGDDMFALASPRVDRTQAMARAGEIVERLAAPYHASGGQAFVTCSIGMSFLSPELDDPSEALRQAQMALSSSRKRGGGHFSVFEPSMDHALKDRQALEVDFRHALAERAMTMVYQPQVNIRGAIVGVEALMRWTSEERGPISPSTFVPLAESCGLSDDLGRLALQQAFLDSKNWPGLKVAVNVSGAQVLSGGLVATLRELLAETGTNPQDFELEITEGVLLADEVDTYETLHAVRKLGFSLSLDDFGTGYSSLSYLRHFPVDKIKIDQSFVSHLGSRPESSAIVKAIIDMADALGLKVIAEGVETNDQVQRLTQSGCNHFQGYFFSRPVEARVIGELLAGRAQLAA
jgi:diguanylate cyclase (GGDEF)-like protein